MSKKLKNSSKKFIFFYPGNINQKTGGYIYENNILKFSKKNKFPINFIELSSNYPNPNIQDIKNLNKITDKIKSDNILIFDGLVLEGLHKSMKIFDNFKIIALIHHPLYLEFNGKKSEEFFKRAIKIYKKIDYFIVTSHNTKKLLSETFKIKSSKISIVEPGIEKFKKFKKIPSAKLNLLTCGSIIERKKYDYLIKEIKNIENIQVNIVGDVSRESKYTNKIKKLISNNKLKNKVILHGKISQVKLESLYSNSDFYISTSEYEGFGMSLANAVLSKLPIISYKTSTILKTIGKSGVLYFDNHKKDTLKKLINENCFNKKKYKFLKKNITNKKYLTNYQSAKLFVKAINYA
ncbi:glycosyltransferase family 4 protein [Alphaproteobacteria bacterium]|nr:glycosyltransferase family 4 protein [Alphaproteobacteria bacterium]